MKRRAISFVALTIAIGGVSVAPGALMLPMTPEASSPQKSSAITGRVTFTDHSPASGAFVAVRAGTESAIADANGYYTITDVTGGLVMLDASVNVGGTIYTGTAFVGLPPGGGTVTANIVVRPDFFPPF